MVSRSITDVKSQITEGCKVCFVSGKFNVVHPGHLRLFRHAKEICDHLVVAVYPDHWSPEILLPLADRLEGVRSNIWVDDVFVLSESIESAIINLRPHVVLKGKEHQSLENIEEDPLDSYGGMLRFAGGHLGLSSSDLLHAEQGDLHNFTQHTKDYLRRHQISINDLRLQIEAMREVRTLVIGDLIIDRYIDCEPIGMSAEDPTVVVSPIAEKQFVGGAGVVASHAKCLGKNASLVSIRGDDEVGEFALDELEKIGVNAHVSCDPERPTTFKTRYRARNQTLLRVNDFRDHQINNRLAEHLQSQILDVVPEVDVVVFSDFSYGLLTTSLVNKVIEAGRKRKIILAADSQSSSQVGDVTKFHDVSLLTPTEKEARLAVRDNNIGLVGISQRLREVTRAEYVPITLGSEGVFLHHAGIRADSAEDDRVPALNKNPVDVSGAGDAFLVSTALCLALGADIWKAMYIGSVASACQVSRIGNNPLTTEDLLRQLSA